MDMLGIPMIGDKFMGQKIQKILIRAVPCVPKSPGDRTSPSPKCPCQMRLTQTRAVSVGAGRIHSANAVRGCGPIVVWVNREGIPERFEDRGTLHHHV